LISEDFPSWSEVPFPRQESLREIPETKKKRKDAIHCRKKRVFFDIPTIVIPKVLLKIVTLPLSLSVIKSTE
jgi:hypothetical protein